MRFEIGPIKNAHTMVTTPKVPPSNTPMIAKEIFNLYISFCVKYMYYFSIE